MHRNGVCVCVFTVGLGGEDIPALKEQIQQSVLAHVSPTLRLLWNFLPRGPGVP